MAGLAWAAKSRVLKLDTIPLGSLVKFALFNFGCNKKIYQSNL